jgi:hypothetical protein
MILRDARVLFGAYALSADHHEITMTVGAAERDGTRFGHTAECVVAGLPTLEVTGTGFVRVGPTGPDAGIRGQLGLEHVPITIMSGDPALEPAAVEFFLAEALNYKSGAAVGDLYAFSWTAKGNGVAPAAAAAVTAQDVTAQMWGTAVQLLPNVPVAVAVHILAVSGTTPTLDVRLESAPTSAFASMTERWFPATMTAAGAVFARVPGSTDTWWRLRCEVGGTSPRFTVLAIIGQ